MRNEDFLVSNNPDFHPTDVLEDADGSLLVVDTGGWFRIGCPTSQIAKPEITGAIYRVRRTDAVPPADPRGRQVAWDRLTPAELCGLLDDPRFAVRDRAVDRLAQQLPQSLPVLREVLRGQSARARRNAVWALARAQSPDGNAALSQALDDSDPSVRLAAAHTVGLNRVATAFPSLRVMVASNIPAARRAAATALGRLERNEAVPSLLAALRTENDRFLDHALIHALIVIADRQATLAGLSDPSPRAAPGGADRARSDGRRRPEPRTSRHASEHHRCRAARGRLLRHYQTPGLGRCGRRPASSMDDEKRSGRDPAGRAARA